MHTPSHTGTLGETLRRAREAEGFTLEQLGLRASFSASYLHDVEKGRRGVTAAACDRLSIVLGLDRVELYALAGLLTEKVLRYLSEVPQALAVLELLAASRAAPEEVAALCRKLRAGRLEAEDART